MRLRDYVSHRRLGTTSLLLVTVSAACTEADAGVDQGGDMVTWLLLSIIASAIAYLGYRLFKWAFRVDPHVDHYPYAASRSASATRGESGRECHYETPARASEPVSRIASEATYRSDRVTSPRGDVDPHTQLLSEILKTLREILRELQGDRAAVGSPIAAGGRPEASRFLEWRRSGDPLRALAALYTEASTRRDLRDRFNEYLVPKRVGIDKDLEVEIHKGRVGRVRFGPRDDGDFIAIDLEHGESYAVLPKFDLALTQAVLGAGGLRELFDGCESYRPNERNAFQVRRPARLAPSDGGWLVVDKGALALQ